MSDDARYDPMAAAGDASERLQGYLDELAARVGEAGAEFRRLQPEEPPPGVTPHGHAADVTIFAELERACGQLAATTREITAAGPGQSPQLAFAAVSQLRLVESDVDDAEAMTDDLAPAQFALGPGMHRPSTVFASIRKTLSKAWRALWTLISHLTKVREWSITGEAGSGTLGFAKASIEVTFG
jgi:hypothetical protein